MEELPEGWVTEIAPSGNIYTYNKNFFEKIFYESIEARMSYEFRILDISKKDGSK